MDEKNPALPYYKHPINFGNSGTFPMMRDAGHISSTVSSCEARFVSAFRAAKP